MLRLLPRSRKVLLLACLAISWNAAVAAPSREERRLEELRNTVVNLLQGLVERGVLTREQAQAIVQSAQQKAASDAELAAKNEQEQAKADEGAIRVPYVPQIVKDEIRREVASDLKPQVTREVIEQAKAEAWAVPGALPDWIKRVRLGGDVRVREQGDLFASDNAQNAYLNFSAINSSGGVVKAGTNAFVNVTEDRERLRLRARFGVEADLEGGWNAAIRLASGNLQDPVSTNQTLGTTGGRYQIGIEQAYLKWTGYSTTWRQIFSASGGRFANPWLSTDLVWDPDLNFEGVATNYRLGLFGRTAESRFVYLTLGAFPIQEVELSSKDKWLFGGQLGFEWKFDSGNRLRFGAAYYDFENIAGTLNAPGSSLFDFTAPQFLQRGNTLYDIRNDLDQATNLYALAANYRLVDATAVYEWLLTPRYRLGFTADYVQNIGYKTADIVARTGQAVPARNRGYLAELNFGAVNMARPHAWRGFIGYKHLERDAVLDAFTDSDFHLGGTDAKGFYVGADYALAARVSARLRYLSANEIDGPPLGIDVFQLDLNAQF